MKATFEVEGIELLVSYDYAPAEPRTYNDPGCGAGVDIYEVWLPGTDIDISALLSEDVMSILASNAIELHQDSEDE